MSPTAALASRKPFLPSDLPPRDPGRALTLAAWAAAKSFADGWARAPETYIEQKWPHDRAAIALTRAATNPAITSVSSWASPLSPTATGEFLGSLVGQSAGARLIDAGLRVDLTGVAAVLIPHRSTNLPNVDTQWIAEAGVFPVRQYTLATSQLGPVHKLMSSVVATRELLDYGNGEQVLGVLLREDVAASLDASIFSNAAASSVRPAGILNGVSALSATAGANETAVRGDIGKLAAVVGATGSGNIAFVTSPGYAVRLATYPNATGPNIVVWPSIAVADGTIICVAVDAFVSGFGSVPRIATSRDAVVHMEDTSPQPIGQPGNIVAAPARSAFQTDSVVIKCVLDASWVLRSTGAVAWITGATW
jgi:Phage capsid family